MGSDSDLSDWERLDSFADHACMIRKRHGGGRYVSTSYRIAKLNVVVSPPQKICER